MYGRVGNIASLLEVLDEISSKKGILVSRIALSWILRHDNVVVIPSAKKEGHVKQNAEAAEIELRKEDLDLLEELSSNY